MNVTRDLGGLFDSTGQEESADRVYEDLVAERTNRLGKDQPATLLARDAAIGHLERAGRWAIAIEQREALLEDEKRVLGARHVYVWLSERALAQSMAAAGRRDEAVRLIEMALSGTGPCWAKTTRSCRGSQRKRRRSRTCPRVHRHRDRGAGSS